MPGKYTDQGTNAAGNHVVTNGNGTPYEKVGDDYTGAAQPHLKSEGSGGDTKVTTPSSK
jgi:hypothetical protein